MRGLREGARPRQWAKNLCALGGWIFSGQLWDVEAGIRAWCSVAAFCCLSSSGYLFNDWFDRERDRGNPRTAGRPLASGRLRVGTALGAAGVLACAGLGISWWLGPACAGIAAGYLLLSAGYTTRLKHVVIADVMGIAFGFVLRVLHGVFAVSAAPTPWIAMCMFWLALFLGFCKRRGEFVAWESGFGGVGGGSPGSGAGSGSAGGVRRVFLTYRREFLDQMIGMTATLTLLSYALFTVFSHDNPTLIATMFPVAYCVMRYMLLVLVHGLGESPEDLLLSDRGLWAGIAVWVALCVAILYGDPRVFIPGADWSGGVRR